MNKTKQATYDFIIKELSGTLGGHDGMTLQDMLLHYFDIWFDEPASKRKYFTEFVREYVLNYPMIPFETYDIANFLRSVDYFEPNEHEEIIEQYIQLVTTVIHDIMNGKQAQYEA